MFPPIVEILNPTKLPTTAARLMYLYMRLTFDSSSHKVVALVATILRSLGVMFGPLCYMYEFIAVWNYIVATYLR